MRLPRWMQRRPLDPHSAHIERLAAGLDLAPGATLDGPPGVHHWSAAAPFAAVAAATQHYTGTRPLGYHYSVDQDGHITDHTAPPQETAPTMNIDFDPRTPDDCRFALATIEQHMPEVVAELLARHQPKPDPVDWKRAVDRAANRLEDLLGGAVHSDMRQLQAHTLDMLLDRLERVDHRAPAPDVVTTGHIFDRVPAEVLGYIAACAAHVRSHGDRPYQAADRLEAYLRTLADRDQPEGQCAPFSPLYDTTPIDMDPDEGDGIRTLWRMRGDLATFNLNQRDGVGRALDAIAGRHLEWLDDWTRQRLGEQADPDIADDGDGYMTVPEGWVAFDPANPDACKSALGYAVHTLSWVAFSPDDVTAIDAVLERIEQVDPRIIVDHVRMRQKAAAERRSLGTDPKPHDVAYSESAPVVIDWDVRRPPARGDCPTIAVQAGQEGLVLLTARGWVSIVFDGHDDVRRWQEHSVTLNALAYRLAELTTDPVEGTPVRWTPPDRDSLLGLLNEVAQRTVPGELPSCVCLTHVGPCTVHRTKAEVVLPVSHVSVVLDRGTIDLGAVDPDRQHAPSLGSWPDVDVQGIVAGRSGPLLTVTVDRSTMTYPHQNAHVIVLARQGTRAWDGVVESYEGGAVVVRLEDEGIGVEQLGIATRVAIRPQVPPQVGTRRIVDSPQA